MFAYNDAWLMNESLALYMSTNTFSNPLFNQNNLTPSDYSGAQAQTNDYSYGQGELLATDQTSMLADERFHFKQHQMHCSAPSAQKQKLAQRLRGLTGPSRWAASHKQRWLDLYDGLAYSIRSKAFVLELNLKRNLRAIRRFASKNISWMLPILNATESSKRARRSRQDQASFSVSDSFWQSFDQLEPNSKSSLNTQQEQLLSRLERVVQAKRSGQLKRNLEEIASVTGCDFTGYNSPMGTAVTPTDTVCGNNNVSVGRHHFVEEFIHPVEAYGGNDLTWDDTTSEQQQQQQQQACKLDFADSNTSSQCAQKSTTSPSISTSASSTSIGAVSLPAAKRNNISDNNNGNRRTFDAQTSTNITWPLSIGQCTKQRYRPSGVPRSKSADQRGFSTSSKTCIVCYANFPNIVTLPCKHNNVCSDCLIEIIYMAVKQRQFPLKCVLCRQKVEQIRVSRRWLISVIGKDHQTLFE